MDNDRTEGAAKNIGGKLKEGLGEITGDQKIKNAGQANQLKGSAQNSWGGVKYSVRDALGSDGGRR